MADSINTLAVKLEYLEKKLDWVVGDITELKTASVMISNKSSEAKRLATEAQEMAEKEHKCLHNDSIVMFRRDVIRTTEKVEEWDKLFRRTLSRFTKAVVAAAIVVGGALVTWLVMFQGLSRDVQTLSKDVQQIKITDNSQQTTINEIVNNGRPENVDMENVVKALNEVLDNREMEKGNVVGKRKVNK